MSQTLLGAWVPRLRLRLRAIPSRLNPHKDAAWYAGSSVLKTVAQFAASLVTVRYLAPEDLGLWNSVALATTYALLLQGGVINGLSRELPFRLGAGQREEALGLAGTAQTFTALSCLLSLACGACALFLFADRGAKLLLAIIAVTIVTALTFYQNYLSVTFRSSQSFRDLSRVQAWNAGLLLLTLPAIVLWHFGGMLGRIMGVSLFMVGMLHGVRPLRVALVWDWTAFRTLMSVGLPIFALAYVNSAAGTADRVILLARGGVAQVGYYSLALYVWQAATAFPLAVATYVYPRMTYSYGKTGDPTVLWRGAWKTAVIMLGLMGPLALAGWFILPLASPVLYPRYQAGVFAAQIILVSAVPYGAVIGVNALWSMKAWRYMAIYQLASSALLVVCPYAGSRIVSNPLTGVALGMLVARLGAFALGMGATYWATRTSGMRVGGQEGEHVTD